MCDSTTPPRCHRVAISPPAINGGPHAFNVRDLLGNTSKSRSLWQGARFTVQVRIPTFLNEGVDDSHSCCPEATRRACLRRVIQRARYGLIAPIQHPRKHRVRESADNSTERMQFTAMFCLNFTRGPYTRAPLVPSPPWRMASLVPIRRLLASTSSH